MTLRPVSAAKVSGRMNCSAAAVMITWTREAALHQRARQLRRFVRGNAAADAERTFIRDISRRSAWLDSSSALRILHRIVVLHQTAAHFFHRRHGRLFRSGGQKLRAPFCNWRARFAATMMKR